jgi:hypothetical protein
MSNRIPNDGVWMVPAFQAATFTAKAPMIWTVDNNANLTWAYTKIGNTVIASFSVGGTSLTGTANEELRIALPAALSVARIAAVTVRIADNGTHVVGWATMAVGVNYIAIRRLDNSNFQLSTNGTNVNGQIIFEVLD